MAIGIDDAIGYGAKLLDDAINKIWPDPESKARAEAMTIQAAANAAMEQMRLLLQIPLAEAQSADKWTSRARPSFMYTMYALILWGIPFSVIAAIQPDAAMAMAKGFAAWLQAIPDKLWEVFGWCFAAYTSARTLDKGIDMVKAKKAGN